MAHTVPRVSKIGPPLCPFKPGLDVSKNSNGNVGFGPPVTGISTKRVRMPSIGKSGNGTEPGGRLNVSWAASYVGSMEWNGKPSRHKLVPGAKSLAGFLNTG